MDTRTLEEIRHATRYARMQIQSITEKGNISIDNLISADEMLSYVEDCVNFYIKNPIVRQDQLQLIEALSNLDINGKPHLKILNGGKI